MVGTTSIENSELISKLLNKAKLNHQVLNAKQHEKEANIIVQAGQPSMITIATNMAGRGTDIVLGGNVEPEIEAVKNNGKLNQAQQDKKIKEIKAKWDDLHKKVLDAGGLHIIGTERHESRRVDNQLRGRSGRQGDPGSSSFYLSLEDSLLRIFASDRVSSIMEKLKMPKGEAIEHPWVNKSIEGAQRKVEARNFDIRKQLLEFDDVPSNQRKVIYEQRNDILDSTSMKDTVSRIREDVITQTIYDYMPPESIEEQWDLPALESKLQGEYNLKVDIKGWFKKEPNLAIEEVVKRTNEIANKIYHFVWHTYCDWYIEIIKQNFDKSSVILDPHTAVGVGAANKLNFSDCVVLSTAHPCKFPAATDKAINKHEELPKELQYVHSKEEYFQLLKNDTEAVKNFVKSKL